MAGAKTPSCPRRTVKGTASLEGVGIHTGERAKLTFKAGQTGTGVVFQRTDLDGRPTVSARLASVSALERRTALANGTAEVHTVEHVLAAVAALDIDDLLIEITGPEPPIMDGSFLPFVEALRKAGPVENGGVADELVVREAFSVTEGDASYLVGPANGLVLSTTIEFPHPLIGRQSASFAISEDVFAKELAPARTFGFVKEVEALRAKGLITGGTTDNAIVLDDAKVVGTKLRWDDEFVRHKAADVLGDLALVGGRIKAHVVATKPSHKGNVALGRAIKQRAERQGAPVMDVRRIIEVMPHRYPFLLVDRIIEIEEKKRIVGIKNVTINEPFFQGHFPGHPIMPGVLIIEAMAQVGGLLIMSLAQEEEPHNKVVYFMALEGVKFRRPVLPGDQLRMEVQILKFGGRTCRMKGEAYVGGALTCEAEMLATIVDR